MAQAQHRPASPPPVGAMLREWRQRRRRSQLDLSLDAAVSQRHLSCVESGRAAPSREMVLRLAAELDVPLRERNALLLAAGFAPAFRERGLDDPEMAAASKAVETLLHAHMPHPALAVDRGWNLVSANAAVTALLGALVDPALLAPPLNVLRLSLDPGGLAPRIRNLAEWRAHLLERLRREVAASADAGLAALLAELSALPAPESGSAAPQGGILVPLVLDTPSGVLSLISTTTVFGTPAEVTLSELAIETFFPADAESAERLRAIA
ncbi:helix-turn-helix transcriptional regulator [Sabulicella glaciei]|uniref:Helix-turn-helix transcriptional regulator n=1 Tax=Sabulicella glaciei TaxID=2984948 RepID=A0ABT3NWF9_9PROT|nr:helix-turn-helix transcriptional regulator [Roseococcus sp. MDT2-1-1]MCW8086493.1 helix-turn-helix transcriptional regulator [Roseococcus sp. MDT2-1-1]